MSADAIRPNPTDPIYAFFVAEPLLYIDKVTLVATEVFYFLDAFFTYLFWGSSEDKLLQATQGGYELTLRFFAWLNIDLNSLNQNGEALIHKAAHLGDLETVQFLAGCPNINLNQQARNGRTALHEAYRGSHLRVVGFLQIQPSINVNLLDQDGRTASQLAQQCSGSSSDSDSD